MRRRESSNFRTSLLLVATALVPSCSEGAESGEGSEAPEWIELSVGFRPSVLSSSQTWTTRAGQSASLADDGSGVWIEFALAADGWTRSANGKQWVHARPEMLASQRAVESVFDLSSGGRTVAQVSGLRPDDQAGRRVCWLDSLGQIFLQDDSLSSQPTDAIWREYRERGSDVDGRRRVIVGKLSAFGLDVWPGEQAHLDVRVPADSALRFVTAALTSTPDARVVFTIRADGVELLRFEQEGGEERSWKQHEIPLPASGRDPTSLTFSVEGDAHAAAFLEPVIGPALVGKYGRRPWGDNRPDIVLFVADTFRADNLAAYGGRDSLTPNLNALVERSLYFRNARSPSSWTLPAHASMFTGLFQDQHGATSSRRSLSSQAQTLAEQLSEFGYRTGAVTDGVFLSRKYGMDQGFGWFFVQDGWHDKFGPGQRSLRRTLDRAFDYLDRDDGRPVFLFVHTYRTHTPYRTGPDEHPDAQLELLQRVGPRLKSLSPGDKIPEVLGDLLDEYRGLYHAGVEDLDSAMGPWLRGLEQRGVLDNGAFVFASDHGEAFYEHGARAHFSPPHDEQIRIPLVFHGRMFAPAEVTTNVSLIDLPRTIAGIAGVPPAPEWGGRSIIEGGAERVLFAARGSDWVGIRGNRKVFFEPDRLDHVVEAYDLDVDPAERNDLTTKAAWPLEFLRSFARDVDELITPQLTSEELDISVELDDRLEALGYAGE